MTAEATICGIVLLYKPECKLACLYASCHPDVFLQCIQEGVRYLMRMLQVRNSVKLNDGVVLHDTATAGFLSEGNFFFFIHILLR